MRDELVEVRVGPSVDGAVAVEVVGEIDLSNAAAVGARVVAACADATEVVLDLQRVEYLDTSGIRMLLDLAGRPGTHLRVVAGEGSVARAVLEVTGLDEVLDVVDGR